MIHKHEPTSQVDFDGVGEDEGQPGFATQIALFSKPQGMFDPPADLQGALPEEQEKTSITLRWNSRPRYWEPGDDTPTSVSSKRSKSSDMNCSRDVFEDHRDEFV